LIKAVTFDMWNTLISDKDYTEPRLRCLTDSLRESNAPSSYDQTREAYIAAQEYVYRVWRDENYRFVPISERLDFILNRLSARLTDDLRIKVLKEFEELAASDPPPLVEGVQQTLEYLGSKYKMGIICDTGLTPGRVLRQILTRQKILGFFAITVFSDENGYNKPHKTMFEKALANLHAEPSEVVHVGDLLNTDIAGAKAVGMKAVWLSAAGKVNLGPYKPDYEIKMLPQIIDILNKMN
jgi:putative hydrolase of the HAD superfamily